MIATVAALSEYPGNGKTYYFKAFSSTWSSTSKPIDFIYLDFDDTDQTSSTSAPAFSF